MRITTLFLGGLWLFWLPVEDDGLALVFFFAIGICTLIFIRMLRTRLWGKWQPGYRLIGLGSLAGILVTPAALLLMAFKSGLHGHSAPDYTPSQVILVLKSFQYWVAVGVAVGLGLHFWISSASRP